MAAIEGRIICLFLLFRDSLKPFNLLGLGDDRCGQSLPEDPAELRKFTQLLLAEVKSQAMLIEKLRHQLSGHRIHRFGSKSESIEQLQLALESSEIATAAMTARLRLPDEEALQNKPKRRPIPDHIPRQHIELTTGDDACAECGGYAWQLAQMSSGGLNQRLGPIVPRASAHGA